jgi:hypothetical protein
MGDLFPSDRCISHRNWDDAKRALKAYKDKVLKESARDKGERATVIASGAWWPFD